MGLSLGISPIEMNNIWHKYKTSVDKYFRILGVRPDAPVEIIRKRYYELAKFFHPDRFRHRSVSEQQFAEQKMKLINEAYNQILKFKQSVN
jgi:DnaJ-class molecular chaperone